MTFYPCKWSINLSQNGIHRWVVVVVNAIQCAVHVWIMEEFLFITHRLLLWEHLLTDTTSGADLKLELYLVSVSKKNQ